MKAWIARMLIEAIVLALTTAHDWVFNEDRAKQVRFRLREHWWRYHQRAQETKNVRDDKRAASWAALFKFGTSPDEAAFRGDLE